MIMIKVDNAISSIVYWVSQYFPILPIYIAICINLIHFPPFNIYWFLLIIHTDYTTPEYLTYIMDYITLYCICQDVFWFFCWRLISMGRNKGPNKKPSQACLSFLSLEERCRSQQSFLVVRTLICFQQASSLFPELSNNVEQTTTGGARCQNRTALLVPKTRVLPLHFILLINGTIVVPTAYFSRYKPSGLCYASR